MKDRGSKTLRLEGLIPTLEEDAKAYEGLDKRAMAYLSEIGARLPDQPLKNGEPLIPRIPIGPNGASLGVLDERGLSDLYAQLNAYLAYTSAQYGVLEVKVTALKEKLELTEAKIMFLMRPPESSKKTRARLDPRVQKIRRELTEAKAKMLLLSKIVSSTDKEMSMVSREVKIRELEREGTNREESMKTRRGGGHGVSGSRRVR